MNQLLILVLIISSFAACAPMEEITEIQGYEITRGIDFKKYSDQGFHFTPEEYRGDYISIGMLSTEISPNAYKPESTISKVPEGYEVRGYWLVQNVSLEDVIQKMYEDATALGADAIMNFDYDVVLLNARGGVGVLYKLTVSGFAIKRE